MILFVERLLDFCHGFNNTINDNFCSMDEMYIFLKCDFYFYCKYTVRGQWYIIVCHINCECGSKSLAHFKWFLPIYFTIYLVNFHKNVYVLLLSFSRQCLSVQYICYILI